MSFRSRPVLDRKHRPRWQDELRTQQLIVVGFAIAIAAGDRDLRRGRVERVLGGALPAGGRRRRHELQQGRPRPARDDPDDGARRRSPELQAQLTGGPRDQIIKQQIEQLNSQASGLTTTAAASLVDGEVLASRAGDFDVSVTDDEVDAEVAKRLALPERVHANLILIEALPEDAEAGDEPTDEQRQAALDEAQAAKERVEGGEDFATVAKDVSDDFTGGLRRRAGLVRGR